MQNELTRLAPSLPNPKNHQTICVQHKLSFISVESSPGAQTFPSVTQYTNYLTFLMSEHCINVSDFPV